MRASTAIFIFLFSALIYAPTSRAFEAWRGPLSSSMGGTGIAGIDGVEGVLINPAQIALLKDFAIDGYYRDGDVVPGQHRQGMAIGAGDNGPGIYFPGALHYARFHDTGRGPEPSDGELFHIAVAERLGDNFSLGVAGYQVTYRMKGLPKTTQYNGTVGAIIMLNEDYGFGYTLSSFAHPGSNVPEGLRERVQQGLGFYGSIADIAAIRFDVTRHEVENPDKKLVYMAGFESLSGKFAVVRFGYRDDTELDERFLTLGLGFNGPRLKLDYAFEKNLKGTSGALHSVDLRLPF